MTEEKRLRQLFGELGAEQRKMLLAFAEFLSGYKTSDMPIEIPEPKPIPRPKNETVVKAVKRLMETYSMLDRGKLLHETSHYMTEHVMKGRPAVEVIDEMETMFDRQYKKLKETKNRP